MSKKFPIVIILVMTDWRRPYFEPHRDPSHDVKKLERWRKEGSLQLKTDAPRMPKKFWLFVCVLLMSLSIWIIHKCNQIVHTGNQDKHKTSRQQAYRAEQPD
jgi:hypothetical protein